MENTVIKPHKPRKEDCSPHIYIDKSNNTIIKVHNNLLKSTVTAALHFIIGMVTRCFDE